MRSKPRTSRPDARRILEVFLGDQKPATAAAYGADLDRLREFLGADDRAAAVAEFLGKGPGRAFELASRWRAEMRTKLSAATVNRRIACLRSLLESARACGRLDWTLELAGLPVSPYRDTRGPGRENVRRMLERAAAGGGPKAARDTAVLRLLADRGLRRNEVAGMRAEDVDLRGSRARVLGKGQSAWEWLDLPQETVEAVGAWLALRPAGEGPLFLSLGGRRAGGPLTAWGVYWLVRTVSRACGCPATPHGLRHTAITDAIQRGYCLPDVQRFSRHRDLRTLQAYYDGCNATELDIAADVARREARNPSGRDNTRKS